MSMTRKCHNTGHTHPVPHQADEYTYSTGNHMRASTAIKTTSSLFLFKLITKVVHHTRKTTYSQPSL